MSASRFLDALHADKPLRVWSLIVTIFGDVVMRQGADPAPGQIWVSPLLTLLEKLGVEAGLARTSLSRLVANGVLERDKTGRNTFYRLTPASAGEFAQAAGRIYGRRAPPLAQAFRVALIDRCADRAAARAALEASGFRFFGPTSALAPEDTERFDWPMGAVEARANAEGAVLPLARDLWKVDALQAAYADFVARFSPLPGADWTPENAIVARIVAVHRFRRIRLRDPGLPAEVLPADWAGAIARELFAHLLADVAVPSEAWLETHHFRSGQTI